CFRLGRWAPSSALAVVPAAHVAARPAVSDQVATVINRDFVDGQPVSGIGDATRLHHLYLDAPAIVSPLQRGHALSGLAGQLEQLLCRQLGDITWAGALPPGWAAVLAGPAFSRGLPGRTLLLRRCGLLCGRRLLGSHSPSDLLLAGALLSFQQPLHQLFFDRFGFVLVQFTAGAHLVDVFELSADLDRVVVLVLRLSAHLLGDPSHPPHRRERQCQQSRQQAHDQTSDAKSYGATGPTSRNVARPRIAAAALSAARSKAPCFSRSTRNAASIRWSIP